MRRFIVILAGFLVFATTISSFAASGRVLKVLPHFLDLKGRHSLSPSLFDRDAYQLKLRQNPNLRSALRYDILWRARQTQNSKLKLRAELRGTASGKLPRETTLETELEVRRGGTSKWSSLKLEGEAFRNFGDVTAWRVTLWDGDQLLGEQKSFLW
jgi:hypothetical protein